MAITPPPGYTPPPADLPQRGDRATFSQRVDNWVIWFSTVILSQLAAIVANAYNNALEAMGFASAAQSSASAAASSASAAASSATAATTTANAVVWVSGTTYSQFQNVISPADARTYRRRTAAGSGTTDPSQDPTNYRIASPGPVPQLRASHRLTSGAGGGTSTSAAFNGRPLNSLDLNTIVGASLTSNQIILPAGTYSVRGYSVASNAGAHQAHLYNVTDSAPVLTGSNASTAAGNASETASTIEGQFTLTATKTLSLRHWTTTGSAASGLGVPVSATGMVEIYAQIDIQRID